MYRAVAKRYDQVSKDLHKNIQSELSPEGSVSGSDLVSDPSPSSLHSKKLNSELLKQTKPNSVTDGFDFFLGSGGNSDLSKGDSDEPRSSISESDRATESDNANERNGDGVTSRLQQRVRELEDELHESMEELKVQEENSYHDHCSSKILSLEEHLSTANEKLRNAATEIENLKEKLEGTNVSSETKVIELNLEKKKVFDLEEHSVMLQNKVLGLVKETEDLKGAAEIVAKQYEEKSSLEAGILDLEAVNWELKAEAEKKWKENLILEAHISELENAIQELKSSTTSSVDKILREKSSLEAEVLTLSQSNAFLQAKFVMLNHQMRQLEADKTQERDGKDKHITELNETVDSFEAKVELLTTEKEGLASLMDSLVKYVERRDDRILQ
ncbi:hypothetical protein OPV22_013281 [Ensete ventricosum]|uniref:NAB domain-containing protein n=1 Tax=Ensete ventricosum TaxID=4639 RepID=A0AAV8R7Y2_ENSVE|nr:hypothetical protein OPV22_013281 [Ensete ventricosum]